MKRSIPALFLLLLFLSNILPAQIPFPDPGQVFRDDVIPKINILIHPDSLNAIVAPGNEESDYHYHATFIFNNGEIKDTIENIGFRLRGNTSRYAAKKSFKISFNTYEPGRKWFGLEKLNINGEHNDPTISRAKICWDVLREMKVPAPRSNHVELFFNNQYVGLFINVEHIDEEFVQLRFGNNDGNLFKCLWPADLNYKGSNPDLYKDTSAGRRTYDLITNTDEDDYSDLAQFINVLNNTPINNLPCELEKIFNVDTYLKVIAADILFGNWDGPIFNKNNFYLYHNIATGKFEYIPYDLDNTLGIDWFNADWPTRNIYEWDAPNEFRPIYERLLEVPEYRNRFSYYMKRFLNEIFNAGHLFPHIENMRLAIIPSVENDILYSLDYGFDINKFNLAFESALGYFHTPIGLKEFIVERNNSAMEQLQLNNIKPIITSVKNNIPNAWQDIVITAKIEDDEAITSVETCYRLNGQPPVCETMFDDGLHADGEAGDAVYGIVINSIGNTASFEYLLRATDESGQTSQQPICGYKEIAIGSSTVPLVVNEFMASNNNTLADDAGEFDDWLEIFSLSDVPIYLGNYYLSDNENIPDKWPLPDVWIQPGEYLIFWADGDEIQGDFHTSFKLSADGEFIGIFENAINDFALIDGYAFGPQTTDVSSARIPNGTGPFQSNVPTPGAFNDPMTAVSDNNMEQIAVAIFPNPFTSELHILSANEHIVNLRVYASSGMLVFSKNSVHEKMTKLDSRFLDAGLYFIKIDLDNGKTVVKKAVLER